MENRPSHADESSGCGSATGCAACPACGAAAGRPSHALSDVGWGVYQALHTTADTFWGPLLAAESATSAIARRGEFDDDDRAVQRRVDDLRRELVDGGQTERMFRGRWSPEPIPVPPHQPGEIPGGPPNTARAKGIALRKAKFKVFGGVHRTHGNEHGWGWDPGDFRVITGRLQSRMVVPETREGRDRTGVPEVPMFTFPQRKCCVEIFRYPLWIRPDNYGLNSGDVDEKKPPGPGFEFYALGAYKESAECACSCCVFEQYVRVRVGPVANYSSTPGEEYRQDCIINSNPKAGTDSGNTADRDPKPGEVVSCAGNAGADTPSSFLAKPFDKMTDTECEWLFRDRPFAPSNTIGLVVITWEFIGVILDRCRLFTVEDMQWFSWSYPAHVYQVDGYDGTSRGVEPWPDGDPKQVFLRSSALGR